jgi:hypothetical protein
VGRDEWDSPKPERRSPMDTGGRKAKKPGKPNPIAKVIIDLIRRKKK